MHVVNQGANQVSCTRKGDDSPNEKAPECQTVTSTQWKTITQTESSVVTNTRVVPSLSIVPTTVNKPTTIDHTVIKTVWKPTTAIQTTVVTTTYPTTITNEHNQVETTIQTQYKTLEETVTTQYPASTIIESVTQHVSAPPLTAAPVAPPQATFSVTPGFTVSLCPSLTGSHRPLPTGSDLTFGCKPGYVCNPPKESNCNLFPGPPSDDFLCNPCDCMIAPPFHNVTWNPTETSYYPPSYGYFNLDPEPFGLSYDIFAFNTYTDVVDSCTTTRTTGNWGPQATLSEWPHKPSTTSCGCTKDVHDHSKRSLQKRDLTPAICYDDCNNAYLIAGAVGKTDDLCKPGSPFLQAYNSCATCIGDNSAGKNPIDDYVNPVFEQYFNFCKGKSSTPMSTGNSPDPAMQSMPPVETTNQQAVSSTGFTVVQPVPSSVAEEIPSSTPASTSANATMAPSPITTTTVVSTVVTLPGTQETEPEQSPNSSASSPAATSPAGTTVDQNDGQSTYTAPSATDPTDSSGDNSASGNSDQNSTNSITGPIVTASTSGQTAPDQPSATANTNPSQSPGTSNPGTSVPPNPQSSDSVSPIGTQASTNSTAVTAGATSPYGSTYLAVVAALVILL